MSDETSDFEQSEGSYEEPVEVSEALRARFAFGYTQVKPISDEKLGQSRVKRTMHQQRKAELVAGPKDYDQREGGSPMPMGTGVVAKYRTPRAFMDEALKYLHPEEIGPAFAKLFLSALESKDSSLLKILLPYVFGSPAKDDSASGQGGVMFGELLSVLREPPIPNPTGKRGTTGPKKQSPVVDLEPFHLPEESQDE